MYGVCLRVKRFAAFLPITAAPERTRKVPGGHTLQIAVDLRVSENGVWGAAPTTHLLAETYERGVPAQAPLAMAGLCSSLGLANESATQQGRGGANCVSREHRGPLPTEKREGSGYRWYCCYYYKGSLDADRWRDSAL